MNHIKLNAEKGMTLIELIILMVVLAVGLTGVLTVIMTVTNSKYEPMLSWQAIEIGNEVIDSLLNKQYQTSMDCVDLKESEKKFLCEYQGINKQKLNVLFPDIAKEMGSVALYDVSIDLRPFYEEKMTRDVLAINVTVSHPQLGEIRLSALKAARNQDDKKAKRIHVY